jgi:hypothetical protein
MNKRYKIRNSYQAPKWHRKWFTQHYANWLSGVDPSYYKEVFYATDISTGFVTYICELGYEIKLMRPLLDDEHLVVFLSKEEYVMERLRVSNENQL